MVNWDIDFGFLFIIDYYYELVFDLVDEFLISFIGIFLVVVNGLMNGKNVYLIGIGSCVEFIFIFGKKYFLCFVNIGLEMIFCFVVDQYCMIVVVMDFIFIQFFEIDIFFIVIGQCYDVIIEVDQFFDVVYWV